jgi:carboxyl-terminal processing protease
LSLARSALLPGFAIGLLVGVGLASWLQPFGGGEEEIPSEALRVIEENYWRKVDPVKLRNASVEEMVQDLRRRYDDRYSRYFDPKTLEHFEAATSGEFSGIGLAVSDVPGGLRVARVYENTPAKEAGIEEGDLIVAVEGRSIAGEPAQASTARIKGPPGTEVEITVRTPGQGARDLEVERAEVRIPAVRGTLRRTDGGKVGYVELANFTEGAHGELRAVVERLAREGAEGIVLDLRGNGGGLLNEAVLTSSVFVEDGAIVSTEGRAQEETTYEAVGDALPERPMVVLIDRNTASAAEILASAVADHGIATVVGTRSLGKGTFQEVIHLESGGALDLTVGEYVTADGKSLAGKGIKPDVWARDDPATPARDFQFPRPSSDEALREALAVLGRELR